MGPQLIGPSGQTVPNQFGPHGQMVSKNLVPNQFGPPKQIFRLSRGIGCEDPNFLGPYVHEYIPNLLWIICPGGSILWV